MSEEPAQPDQYPPLHPVDPANLAVYADQICQAYLPGFPHALTQWWFLDLEQVFGWHGTVVDGEPAFVVVARITLQLNNPMIGVAMDELARNLVDRAAFKVGWRERAKAPQTLGLVQGSIVVKYKVVTEQNLLVLSGGLGFRVL